MRVIWKYTLPMQNRVEIEMPASCEPICVQLQHGQLCLWVKVYLAIASESTVRIFRVLRTGEQWEERNLNYIGTVQTVGGSLVWHIFEER